MRSAVVAKDLSKQYQIGELHRGATFRESLARIIRNPFLKMNFETIWAIKDVSFEVEAGDVVGVVGGNGAGKSTLLKLLAKITYPTKGSIDVHGRVASLLEVGTGFHLELTGRENIYLNGSILGMKGKEIDTKLDEIIDFSGIRKFIDTPVKRYSSGMRLRLGFSVAAHLEAEVLLIDEILAVGDAQFQKKCLDTMGDIGQGGRTVLFVSHNLEAVENLCRRVIWIDDGVVRKDGNPREVISSYLSTFATAESNQYDLTNVAKRGGNGQVQFTKMEFLNADRQPQPLFRTGDSLIARLHYDAQQQVQYPHFAMELFTELGTKATSFNTWSSGFEIPSIGPGKGYIELETGPVTLVAGRYYVSLWLATFGNIWFDRLDQVAILDIQPSDFYLAGKPLTKQHFGIVLFPCSWKLRA